MAIDGIGCANAEQLPQGGRIEVMIPLDPDARNAPARPQLHLIQNRYLIGLGRLLLVIHLHVEVSQPLVVVAQAVIALVEQIVVHGALFKDGNHPLYPRWAHSDAFHLYLHDRSLAGGKAKICSIGFLGIVLGFDLDFSFQPVLAPVVLEHSGQSAI